MSAHEAIESRFAADVETGSPVYVPTLERTEGQPPPVAANGGLYYMSFDRDGDAGTAAAIEAALDQIAQGHAKAFRSSRGSRTRPPAPSRPSGASDSASTKNAWSTSGRTTSKSPRGVWRCRSATPFEYPSYSIVASNALWRDPARKIEAKLLREAEEDIGRRNLYFPPCR